MFLFVVVVVFALVLISIATAVIVVAVFVLCSPISVGSRRVRVVSPFSGHVATAHLPLQSP